MTAPFGEYSEFDALGLAELIRRRQVQAAEVVTAAVERIAALDGPINSVVVHLYEQAHAAAQRPVPSAPFAGVPYLLKDMVAHAGTPLSLGSRLLKTVGYVPDFSHEVILRSEAAGLIVVGKTNACEFGLMPVTEPEAYGPTRNPWDLDRSPGGSSGGSAAAVALGLVPMAHGNDGGGSIRIPASACGVFGLKPSRGRNPGDVHESHHGTTVEHCLCRSVRDSAALLDVTRGPRPGDRFWAPPPERPYLDEVTTEPGPLRIAFTTTDFCGRRAHPDAVAAVEDAARLLEDLGHHVDEAAPDVSGSRFNEAFAALWATMAAAMYPLLLESTSDRPWIRRAAKLLGERALVEVGGRLITHSLRSPLEPLTRVLADMGAGITEASFRAAATEFQRATYAMAAFFQHHDGLLTPVLGEPPVPIDNFRGLDRDGLREQLLRYVAFTPIANVSGQPAMSVPLYWNSDGLPIGVQFIGGFADETTLFRLAGQLERARPWQHRQPPATRRN